MKDQLVQELKEAIIEALNLEEIQPGDIDPAAPLFREGLGLDSIDALEIIIILDKKYGIKMANPAESKAVFYSVNTLADFVAKNRTK
ncbi:phosphopantetheine-binding protein [uncultured Alistipes sp.]|jgi:acyl carrier protein|uniref:phosphopantetheine-binding protein n=1 Tax=uncultured Alistipes sp. TaxID=538949 RepID=UPI0025D3B463|nr:phosphopantetheine-binding protein [uncultured Alistipes sp.]